MAVRTLSPGPSSGRARALAAAGLAACALALTSCDPTIHAVLVASGFTNPMYATAPPGDPRLFVVQRGGLVRIVSNGQILPTPFLDIRGQVRTNGEEGLLGLAFPDDYAASDEFYVYFINASGDSVLSRFRVGADPNRALPGSQENVLVVDQPAGAVNHKGGTIAFSPADGMLYWALGDGGGSAAAAQDPQSLLGKMLRLDVGGGPGTTYRIPADNPFRGADGTRDEIWAFGFRNPFRWSFDRVTGDLWVGDVGQNAREEVDFEAAGDAGGRNYGWPVHEGTLCNMPLPNLPCESPSAPNRFTFPVHQYANDASTCAITGGVLYRGSSVLLQGKYLFADFCAGRLRERLRDGSVNDLGSRLVVSGGQLDGIVAFGEDGFGEVHLVSLQSGDVHRLE
jgi:glucose/arabinose dehydrogenase